MTTIKLHAGKGINMISKYLYGHFAEHLGRCIYDGIYVGEDSPIPNTKGFRNDILAALKKVNIPVLRWPGAVLPMSIIGRMASVQKKPVSGW